MKQIQNYIMNTGLRKVMVALYMFTAVCLLLTFSKMPSQDFVELNRWLILAVFGGNALEHFAGAKNAKSGDSPEIPVAK